MAVSTATDRGSLRRRSVAVLATAALGLVTFAGPAQATSGPTVPLAQPVSATATAAGLATDDNSGLTPTPTPDMPAPLIATAEPEAQAIAAKYQADAQAVTAEASAAKAEEGPLETRAADVQTREANLDAQFASTQARTNTLNGQADALNTAIATHNGEPHQFRLPAQASQLAAYNQEKANLEAQQANLQSQFNALTAQTTQLQSAQAQAGADQAKVNADIQKHNAAVAALQTQITNLKAERQACVAKIAALLQNTLPGTQTGGASPLATAGGDQSAPASVLAPTPQARALPSGGGDQAAPAQVGTYAVATGATGTAGAQAGPAQTGTAPPLTVTQTTVATYLPPAAIAGMSADQAANVNPVQTYGALIPEPSGNYAVLQLLPPAGTTAPPGQQAYTNAINKGAKATTYIAGKPVVVDHVVQASPMPTANQGADTARPALASPLAAASPWAPALAQPGAVVGPPVGITALPKLLAQRGLGKLANQFDLEYAPVLVDANGNPTYAVAPVDAQGNPALGATGKPIIRLSNLALQNATQAASAFANAALIGSSAYSPCPEHSFSGSTRVLMADGGTEPIADVHAGDLIENARPGGGTEVHRVDQVHVTTTDTDFVDVLVGSNTPGGGGTVTGTANHPYYDAGTGGFVDAGALRSGDRLQSSAGTQATVRGVRSHVGPIVTYDLTIDGLHTYYVVAGDTPVLVHNCGGQGLGRQVLGDGVSNHILAGHRYPGGINSQGNPQDPFPQSWTDDDILNAVADVLTDPNSARTWKTGSAKWAPKTGLTHRGDPAVQDVIGTVTVKGVPVKIDVRFEPLTDKVLTAFPIGTLQRP
ncbi:polymorphic toxin-type HINT domain-containing protein [Catenulispora pinisilvae]|uniref:polymorphic toxin-type HINT domain-containing protein n=1 Tax=Catenulispora pinisilvae TaxID=2705253 RepID=UPI001892796B|nr:polymorphic toxin-type HINT domain-containing protein [Catenulispora pinisilvae]